MIVYIILSIAVFAAGIIFVIRRHPDIRFASMALTLTISLASAILLYPYHRATLDPLLAFLSAINSGLRIVAMDVEPDAVPTLALSSGLSTVYQSLLYAYYVLAPVCGSIFVLSVSKSLLDKIVLRRAETVHVFSSLNRNSMELMEYMANEHPDERIMVLDQEKGEEDLIKRASVIRTIFWKRDLEKMKLLKDTNYVFYQMDPDEDENLNAFMKLYRFVSSQPQEIVNRTDIKCFAAAESRELIRRIDQYLARNKEKTVRVSFLNVQNNQAYYLFHQLKDLIPLPQGHFELAVLGAGSTGMAIVRTALWLFDRQDCDLVIHVVDRHARAIASRLKLSCPEILNADLETYFDGTGGTERNYDIRFYEEDTEGYGLERIFGEMDVHPDLVVATCGEDVANQRISERLRKILCKRNDTITCCPIVVRIRRDETSEVLNETNEPDSNVYYFGNQAEKYAQVFAINTILEKMAVRIHMAYLNSDSDDIQKLLYDTGYYTLANHESSLALALAMEYKIKYILAQSDAGGKDKRTVLQAYVDDDENMKKLCRLEHQRWNTYQRFCGWTQPSWHQTELIAKMHNDGKKIRHDQLLLHPAIVENDELAKAEEKADAILKTIREDYTPTDYVNKDAYILKRIPQIAAEEIL